VLHLFHAQKHRRCSSYPPSPPPYMCVGQQSHVKGKEWDDSPPEALGRNAADSITSTCMNPRTPVITDEVAHTFMRSGVAVKSSTRLMRPRRIGFIAADVLGHSNASRPGGMSTLTVRPSPCT